MWKEKSRIIKTVRNVMPSVVTVVVKKNFLDLKREMRAEQTHAEKKNHHLSTLSIPRDKIDAHGMVQIDGGSGFIVDKNGIILTNKHVIFESGVEYDIITNENDCYEAEVIARDPVNDIAILKIKPKNKLPSLKIGDSLNVELGQTVLAFGNALGIFKNTVSQGIISGLSRSLTAHADPKAPPQEMRGLIQTDAAINPGNSGGPLTDIYGNVIGINAAVIAGAQNIGFAIPINSAERDLRDLKKYGRIKRPLLGLHYLMLNHDLGEKLNLPFDYGALVIREHPIDRAVVPRSPADKAGILEHDLILEWDGTKILPEKTILDYLEYHKVGDIVNLLVFRNGKKITLPVVLGERK